MADVTNGDHLDVVVVGAGISGINAAYYLRKEHPSRSFMVFDALDGHGGTWRTHTFPGVRSDTEVFTLGYEFKPWEGDPYASAAKINDYLGAVIEENDLADRFRYQHRLVEASWSSQEQRWSLTFEQTSPMETVQFKITTSFLWMCHGYYRHDEPHRPQWPGMEDFAGQWIHPQHWPEDVDLRDKEVVVIGSGATAATLTPAIAHECAHVTLLQRSPTYYFQSPNADELADQLRSLETPPEWIHSIIRRKAVMEMENITKLAAEYPDATRAGLLKMVTDQLPEGYDVETHFTPRHAPADQRICRILNGDLFAAISAGQVTVVTDEIATFTPTGIVTEGRTEIPADIVVTATGFDLSIFGEAAFFVDGEEIDFARSITYRGILFSGVPNLAWTFGALRMSWTMRAELVSKYLCRLFDYMDANGYGAVTPTLRDEDAAMVLRPFIDPTGFSPGYLVRSADLVPRSGSIPEWSYELDFWAEKDVLPTAPFDDGLLAYTPR